MTSQLDQGDAASFDRRLAEMKKTDVNTSSDAGTVPASHFQASSSTARHFQADWSCFETVFATGLLHH